MVNPVLPCFNPKNSSMSEEKEVIIRLFNPTENKDLKIDYPELAEMDEFKGMAPKFVKFCWYVGNRTSPYFALPREEKISKVIKLLWGNRADKIPHVKPLIDGEISRDILRGIERMVRFNPENRLKAKILADYTFHQLQKLVVIDDDELKKMSFEDKNRYATLLTKVQRDLPDVLQNLETGFGVEVVERNNTDNKVLVSMKDL